MLHLREVCIQVELFLFLKKVSQNISRNLQLKVPYLRGLAEIRLSGEKYLRTIC